MSEKKLSLFELHFHDAVQFGPRTLDGLGDAGDEGLSADESSDEQPAGLPGEDEPAVLEEESVQGGDSGPSLGSRLVGLGVLAAAAYAVRKLLDGEPSGLDALDDIETGIDDVDDPAESGESVSIEVTSGADADSDSGSGRTGLAVATIVALLVVVALAARKLLGDAVEEIEIPDELAEE